MFDDIDESEREEWEDTIQSFVPAFAGVSVKEIGDRSMDAHLVIGEDGKLAVRLMDASETVTFSFPFEDLFKFDVEQFHTEEWELWFGLLEVMRQLIETVGAYQGRVDQVEQIMKLRNDRPPVQ